MARSFATIKQAILDAIAASPLLSGLTSTSATSIWGQFTDAIASAQQVSEQLADLQEARMETIAAEAVPGTPAWLQKRVLEFQYGDTIQLNSDLTLSYAVDDATKRIITRCAIQEVVDTRQVLIKVAKGDIGALQPLTVLEVNGLKAYLSKVKFAGIQLTVVSLQGDRIITGVTVYYDPEYVEADVKTAVLSTINSFYEDLPFNGVLQLSSLTDAIQRVEGVTDVVLGQVKARTASTPLTSPAVPPIERTYLAQSGYLVPETTSGYALADTVTLTPAA